MGQILVPVKVRYQIFPLELDSCCTIAATSAAVRPDLFAAEFMKPVIAVARPLVPALDDIMVGLIIPPIEIGPEPFFPSIIPSDASLIMAVTNADVFVILSDLANCDMPASAMP